jgi:hypothetical protein
MPMRLDLCQIAVVLQIGDDLLAGFESVFAAIKLDPFPLFAAFEKRSDIDSRIRIENADLVESESLANFKVIEIVSWRDLQRSVIGRRILLLVKSR